MVCSSIMWYNSSYNSMAISCEYQVRNMATQRLLKSRSTSIGNQHRSCLILLICLVWRKRTWFFFSFKVWENTHYLFFTVNTRWPNSPWTIDHWSVRSMLHLIKWRHKTITFRFSKNNNHIFFSFAKKQENKSHSSYKFLILLKKKKIN